MSDGNETGPGEFLDPSTLDQIVEQLLGGPRSIQELGEVLDIDAGIIARNCGDLRFRGWMNAVKGADDVWRMELTVTGMAFGRRWFPRQ